ncbi:MAG: DUF4261 domain-containing protein [Massiliimalia sp.]|jgi:hypothetical protein
MGFFDLFKKKKHLEETASPEKQEPVQKEAEPEKTAVEDVPEEAKENTEMNADSLQEDLPNPEDAAIKYSGDKILGFALLNDKEFDIQQFRLNLKRDWDVEPEMKMKNNGLVNLAFMISGMSFLLTHMPAPVPNHEAERAARYNYLWKGGQEAVAGHQSFVVVALLQNPCQDRVRTCTQYTKVCGALMGLPNACAMFMGGQNLVISAEEYRKNIAAMKKADEDGKRYFPIQMWVHIGLARGKNGGCGYTYGLKDFGKKEIEIIDHLVPPMQMYQLISMMSYLFVVNDVQLQDGLRIRLDEKVTVTLKLSAGVFVRGETFKVIFPQQAAQNGEHPQDEVNNSQEENAEKTSEESHTEEGETKED